MNEYSSRNKALILLQDGTIFFGKSLGVKGNAYGELLLIPLILDN
jgi:carbamoyl-phosphate synthase small subunit